MCPSKHVTVIRLSKTSCNVNKCQQMRQIFKLQSSRFKAFRLHNLAAFSPTTLLIVCVIFTNHVVQSLWFKNPGLGLF
jgi:hypothetical protein